MRILFVTPYVPSPIRVRPFNLVKQLAKRHAVTLVTLMQSERDRADAADLRQYCAKVHGVFMPRNRSLWNCLRALPTSTPIQVAYCNSEEMGGTVEKVLGGVSVPAFDVLHVEHLRAARYGWMVSGIPKVYDSVDSISLLLERTLRQNRRFSNRAVSLLELGKTRRFERAAVLRYHKTLTTSESDRQALLALQPEADVEVLTNGVDLEYFQPLGLPREPKTLVFSGKMGYHANEEAIVHFCQRILPLIWSRDPQVRLSVAGNGPSRRVRALARDGRISVTGYVDDIRPYLAKATVAVCPMLYGVGIQNKVIESMAMGTPVVATRQAGSALRQQPQGPITTVDEPAEFAGAVLRLLGDEALRARLSAEGRAYVEENHDWGRVSGRLETIYEGVIEGWRRRKVGDTNAMAGPQPVSTIRKA